MDILNRLKNSGGQSRSILDLLKRAKIPSGEEFASVFPAVGNILSEKLSRGVSGLQEKRRQAEATEAPPIFGVKDQRVREPTPTVLSALDTPAPREVDEPANISRVGPVYRKSGGKTWLIKEGGERIDVTPPKKITSFGVGTESAYIRPELFDELMKIEDEDVRMDLAELSGQESSYGYAGPQITEVEESYGPYHINLRAGRKNPSTGSPFTQQEAEDWETATEYALSEYLRTGGLGAWNPGAYPFYQDDLPKRARTKKFIRGK